MNYFIRIVALILVLAMIFVFPVSADEGDNDNWIDVLDYCTPNDSGSMLVTVGANGSVSFNHGITLHGWYVDIVCGITGTIPTSVSITYGSLTRELTMVHVGGSVYRFYGTLSGYASSAPVINFTSTGTSYVSFVSFDICCVSSEHFPDIASGTLDPLDGTTTTKTMASSSSWISWANVGSSYELTLVCSNWRKYDYLDFMVNVVLTGSVTSVSASLNGVNVPCEVSFVENGNVLWPDTDGEMYYDGHDYYINVRLDLRGLDRTSSVSPQLHITGSGGGSLYVTSCNGYIVAEGVNPLVYHFRKLQLNLSSWFASLEQSMLDNLASMKQFLYTKFKAVTDLLEALPVRIAEEISKIFVPTEGKIAQVQQESQDLAEDRLGAVYQSVQIIGSLEDAFKYQTAQGSVVFPSVTVDLAGVPFTFGGWDVQVVPDGFGGIVGTLK